MRKSLIWPASLAMAAVVMTGIGLDRVHARVAAGLAPAPAGAVLGGLGPVPAPDWASVDLDFAQLPDGPMPANVGGRFFRTVDFGRNATAAAIDHGLFSHGVPTAANAADYLETTLGNHVHRIGATAVFADNLGDIALVAWQSSLAVAQASGRIPNAGIHFVASATQWHLSLWDSRVQHEIVLAAGTYTDAGGAGQPRSFEVSTDGDTATVHLPDGAERTVADPRIAAWTADDACWELYEFQPGERPAALTAAWAD